MVPNGGAVRVVVAVLQQQGFDAGVMLQNSNEFRAAVPAMTDDADFGAQAIKYSFS
jgi:hypothetical protein